MTVQTISEQLFEQHCASRSVHLRRIQQSAQQEPDYEVLLCPASVIAEIKQMDANSRDLSRELLEECQEQGMGLAPVKRVREMIASGYPQLKRYSKLGFPGMLVTYNNAGLVNYIDQFTVTKAMFGSPGLYFALDQGGVIRMTGQGFGGGRKVTRNTCRALSALCVLSTGGPAVTRLDVYHNPYATIPIAPSLLSSLADRQFAYGDPHGKSPLVTPSLLEV